MLESLEMESKQNEARWEKMMATIETLTVKVQKMGGVQRQLLGQFELTAEVVRQASEERDRLSRQVEANGTELARIRLEAMEENTERHAEELREPAGGRREQNQGDRRNHDHGEP